MNPQDEMRCLFQQQKQLTEVSATRAGRSALRIKYVSSQMRLYSIQLCSFLGVVFCMAQDKSNQAGQTT